MKNRVDSLILPRNHLFVEEKLCDFLNVVAMFGKKLLRPLMRGTESKCEYVLSNKGNNNMRDHLPHFVVQHLPSLFTEGLLPALGASLRATVADWSNNVVHAKVGDSLKGETSDLLEIVLGARGDVFYAEENLLRHTAAKGHTDPVQHLW